MERIKNILKPLQMTAKVQWKTNEIALSCLFVSVILEIVSVLWTLVNANADEAVNIQIIDILQKHGDYAPVEEQCVVKPIRSVSVQMSDDPEDTMTIAQIRKVLSHLQETFDMDFFAGDKEKWKNEMFIRTDLPKDSNSTIRERLLELEMVPFGLEYEQLNTAALGCLLLILIGVAGFVTTSGYIADACSIIIPLSMMVLIFLRTVVGIVEKTSAYGITCGIVPAFVHMITFVVCFYYFRKNGFHHSSIGGPQKGTPKECMQECVNPKKAEAEAEPAAAATTEGEAAAAATTEGEAAAATTEGEAAAATTEAAAAAATPEALAEGAATPEALAEGAATPEALAEGAATPEALAEGAATPEALAEGAELEV